MNMNAENVVAKTKPSFLSVSWGEYLETVRFTNCVFI